MAFVLGRCPNCGGEVQLDESKDKGFCLHCGSPIQVQEAVAKYKVEFSGNVTVEGISTTAQLKANAEKSFSLGEYENAEADWKKVLSMDCTDYESYWGLVRILMAKRPICKIFTDLEDPDYVYSERNIGISMVTATGDENYERALKYAPTNIRLEYEAAISRHNAKAPNYQDEYIKKKYEAEREAYEKKHDEIRKSLQCRRCGSDNTKISFLHGRIICRDCGWNEHNKCPNCGGDTKLDFSLFGHSDTNRKCKKCGQIVDPRH